MSETLHIAAVIFGLAALAIIIMAGFAVRRMRRNAREAAADRAELARMRGDIADDDVRPEDAARFQ